MKPKIIFFGSGEYTIPIIDVLKKHCLVLTVTTEKKDTQEKNQNQFIKYLENENIPFISSNLKNDKDIQTILNLKPDVGVLASYGAIVPELEIGPPAGGWKLEIYNIHPSFLPKYKGPSPIQTTILNGDRQTGVTIIKLDEQIDHGPIVEQKIVELSGNETMEDLKNKLFAIGAEMIDTILTKIENGETIRFTEQDRSNESFTQKITKQRGFVNIDNLPDPTMLERIIRAFHPWPGVWTEYKLYGKTRRIKLLPNQKIQVEGKKVMTLFEFTNGYQKEGEELLKKLSL